MNIHHIEEKIKALCKNINEETFIYEFLLSYGISKASVTRLQKGDFNSSKKNDEVLWKKKIFFKVDKDSNLLSLIDDLKRENRILKYKPMFIMVTDFKNILVLDLKVGDTLDIPIKNLAKHFEFFLPLVGMEKTRIQSENPADIKAAEKLGKLYDILVEENHPRTDEEKHALNVFLSRLLFCFFAEDTNIFPEGLFINSIASHTKSDGSDLNKYLSELFKILNLEKRKSVSGFLADFPYVNGGLFKEELKIPKFNSKSHKIIIECGFLNWSLINPDIFGSMIQSVANPEIRSDMGMHYTSVVNIMKVIEPLFLNDLKKELKAAGTNKKKLKSLLNRLYHLRIFDPACGSGNFLIIAYKELCAIEIEIYKALYDEQMSFRLESGIKTSQFFGIEINDFACETAKLSLWLAEHQMNLKFEEVFGETKPSLPLEDGGNIVCGNATRINWEDVCPKEVKVEIYILGNPPYKGARYQDKNQKNDLAHVFDGFKNFKMLDYISCWFYKGSEYIKGVNAKISLVTTNSVSQGGIVSNLWPKIITDDIEIFYAHKEFKWTNNARKNAGVTCVIIGLRNASENPKFITEDNLLKPAKNINAYLIDSENVYIYRRNKPISNLDAMDYGNMAIDGGYLFITSNEKDEIEEIEAGKFSKFIKTVYGADEFLNGKQRYCLWIADNDVDNAKACSFIDNRISLVKKSRLESKDSGTQNLASKPYQFREFNAPVGITLFVPTVTSERRKYMTVGIMTDQDIAIAPNQVVYNSSLWNFGLLSSRLHNIWVKLVAGGLETRIRYSSVLCYNNFPVPKLSNSFKEQIEERSFEILDVRERYSDRTIAELYDPEKMPCDLQKAHNALDAIVELCYRGKPFKNDEDRMEYLLKLYKKMTNQIEEDTHAKFS